MRNPNEMSGLASNASGAISRYCVRELNVRWLDMRAMSEISSLLYAGEYVCDGDPNSSNASRASLSELAVVELMYSRTMGNVFQRANALKAIIISTSAL